ncbi:hypothetical protein BD560DRAFT_445564 [Blakeslea trispora]|nr:hypothetical protein BD560DRAFT_445564 [Blakeslea trispora]
MYDAVAEIRAHPFQDASRFWLKQSIIDYSLLFAEDNQLSTSETEQDLLDDVYSFMKKSCKISGTKAYGAKQSKASSEAANRIRSLGPISIAQRQHYSLSNDIRKDSVFLLPRSSRLQMPASVRELPCLFPPEPNLVHNSNQVILSSIKAIGDDCLSVEVEPSENTFLPPCLLADLTYNKNKRATNFEV